MEYLILLVSLVWVGLLLVPNQAWRPREQLETAGEPRGLFSRTQLY